MSLSPLRNLTLAALGAFGLAGCASYGPYLGGSIGVGSGYYDPYYGRDYGYGYGYGGYDPYYGYGSYGTYGSYSRYGSPYGGWYSGYYYPGSGVYVYDRERRRHRMTDTQRRYWEQRRTQRISTPVVRDSVQTYTGDRRVYRVERRDDQRVFRRREITRDQSQADARQDRREVRREQRSDQRELRRENRREGRPE